MSWLLFAGQARTDRHQGAMLVAVLVMIGTVDFILRLI